jgi:hypothetical protein
MVTISEKQCKLLISLMILVSIASVGYGFIVYGERIQASLSSVVSVITSSPAMMNGLVCIVSILLVSPMLWLVFHNDVSLFWFIATMVCLMSYAILITAAFSTENYIIPVIPSAVMIAFTLIYVFVDAAGVCNRFRIGGA